MTEAKQFAHLPSDDLRKVAEEFIRAAEVSQDTLARLDRSVATLDRKWSGAAQQSFYLQFQSLRPQMARLGVHLKLVGQQLEALIERYEGVDRS